MEVKTPSLSGLKVLDLSQGISGSYCTRLLASWGAEVIKVEKPGRGDIARDNHPFRHPSGYLERNALFLYLNTSKKSLTLDITMPAGKSILLSLLKNTDVLVENYGAGILSGLGLGYDTLKAQNPYLVMTSISAFGQTGPYRDYDGQAIVTYAMGGQMWVCGERDREPLNSAIPFPEYFGGLYGFIGTMMALQARRQTGCGQHVDTSILECMAGSHQFTLTWPVYSNTLLERPGWPGSRAPLSFFECQDGWVNLRLQGIDMGLLAFLFNMPELATDPRFQTPESRQSHIAELEAIVTEKLKGMSKHDVFRTVGEWRGLCGFVSTPGDLLHDPQYRERQFWVDLVHPVAGKLTYSGAPVQMTESPWVMKPAPQLGEHNREIYCGRLGLAEADLVKMHSAGVI